MDEGKCGLRRQTIGSSQSLVHVTGLPEQDQVHLARSLAYKLVRLSEPFTYFVP